MIKLGLGAAAGTQLRLLALGESASDTNRHPKAERTAAAVKPKALAFDLADVRLLDGIFNKAQEVDANYLLKLEPDRLLHNFRVNAGLKPKAAVYGGWESVEPWINIKCHGHTLGHYLSACSMMYRAKADQRFKQIVDYIITELQQCQAAGKTGLICAFPDGKAPLDQILNATNFVGVPWYTMHKIFAGLRDAYLFTSSKVALDVLTNLAEWTFSHTRALTNDQFQHMLGTEHGGMNEVLADLYALTSDKRFLSLAERFCHLALLDPLSQERDTLDGLHSNTQIPKVIGFSLLHELTGQSNYGTAARFFWTAVVNKRSFATGGNGDNEHFFSPADFLRHLGSAKTMETCCTHNMLRLTRRLFTLEPSAEYADYYELALYNGILASQDPDSGMMTYFQPTRPGYLKLYCTPTDSFWCCTGSGMENHAKYGDSIYFHNDNALYVNLFIPSTLTWKQKGLTLTQTTRFPDEGRTLLRFATRGKLELKLRIRQPSWCRELTLTLNGSERRMFQQAGSYIELERVWRNGDTVEVNLPMALRSVPLPGHPEVIALLYGPIVLAGRLGRKGLTPGADIIINERTTGDVLKDQVETPKLAGKADEILKHIKRTSADSLSFLTEGIGDPSDVELIPYFRIAHERYNLYWQTG